MEESRLVGEFTEDAVRGYFEECGFKMIKFGAEHLFPEYLLEHIRNDVGIAGWPRCYEKAGIKQGRFIEFLRSHPDFVAFREDLYGKGIPGILPVEVKFRTERLFPGVDRPLRTIRLPRERVEIYKKYWPSTLLVVVCYRAQTVVATRIDKLEEVRDGRVPIGAYAGRGTWFFDLDAHEFRPLWTFVEGVFDAERGEAMVSEVVAWADEVKAREGLEPG